MHTPTSHSLSPPIHKNTLWGITSRISELLDSEAYRHQSQELERFFIQLNDALDAKVNKAWYNYKDYEQRLFRWEVELEAILLQDQDLEVLYVNFLKVTAFAPHLKHALWDRLLFDKLIELWLPAQEFSAPVTFSFAELKRTPSIPSFIILKDLPTQASPKELGKVFSKIENIPWVQEMSLNSSRLIAFIQNKVQAFISFQWFSHLWNVRSIDLSWNNLWKLDEPRLHAIFSHLWNVRSIDFRNNELWQLDELKLQAIFSHLLRLKSLKLRDNELWQLDEPRLQSIFSHLWNVRSIALSWNNLWKLDEPRLQSIFSHLWNVRSIDLRWNDLYMLDKPNLQAIFFHLWNVRSIDLSWNNLWKLDEPRLQLIFSHLGNARNIDLSGNSLYKLDEPSLQIIFSHLWNIKRINLCNNYLWTLDESDFHTIFSHLWNVRSMDLRLNNLWKLDEPRLQAIFSHLTKIEEVFLDSQEVISKLESLYPNRIGKLKVL